MMQKQLNSIKTDSCPAVLQRLTVVSLLELDQFQFHFFSKDRKNAGILLYVLIFAVHDCEPPTSSGIVLTL